MTVIYDVIVVGRGKLFLTQVFTFLNQAIFYAYSLKKLYLILKTVIAMWWIIMFHVSNL